MEAQTKEKTEQEKQDEQDRIKRIAEKLEDVWKHQACGAEGDW